jgi:hypothetical protein
LLPALSVHKDGAWHSAKRRNRPFHAVLAIDNGPRDDPQAQ